MSTKHDSFFNVETKEFKTSRGNVNLPILYFDFSYIHFFFWADYKKVAPKLEGTGFIPCKFFNGKAGVLLTFFEYRDSAIGPYNEAGLEILCYHSSKKKPSLYIPQFLRDAKNWTLGAYVVNLPVTTELAHIYGREIWNYPKFITDITFALNGKKFCGAVLDPDLKKPMVSLDGKIGFLGSMMHLFKASNISHTNHRGTPLRTLAEVDAVVGDNIGFSGRLQVHEQSTHTMAKNCIDMGLKNKKPFIVLSSAKARQILNEGVPVL